MSVYDCIVIIIYITLQVNLIYCNSVLRGYKQSKNII